MVTRNTSKSWKYIPYNDEEKRNPNSLRHLLLSLLEYIRHHNKAGNKTNQAILAELSEYADRYLRPKNHAKDEAGTAAKSVLTARNVKATLVKNETHLTYWQIEVFARYLGIPTGLLLLVSRFNANVMHGNSEENKILVQRLRESLDALNINEIITAEDMFELSHMFDSTKGGLFDT